MSAILSPGDVKLRAMRESDVDAVIQIELSAYTHPWTRGIFRDCLRVGYHCQVLEQDGHLQGYVVMSTAVGEAHILNICVDPHYQRRGFGRLLVNHLIDTAKRLCAEVVLLEVRPSNNAALALYHGMGFCEVGIRKHYYPSHNGREDALILALNL